jgi:3-phenylpropionate/cinnamic acid dioxygenase small subunit
MTMTMTMPLTESALRDLQSDFSRLLAWEAWLLDSDKLEEWLQLLDPRVEYVALAPMVRGRGSPAAGDSHLTIFSERRRDLTVRVQRVRTLLTHTDEPPPRHRRLISNVLVHGRSDSGEVRVTSSFVAFRCQRADDESWMVGSRDDAWIGKGDGWRLRRRQLCFDQVVLPNVTLLL